MVKKECLGKYLRGLVMCPTPFQHDDQEPVFYLAISVDVYEFGS